MTTKISVSERMTELKTLRQDRSFIQLNNLFLSVEADEVSASHKNINNIWLLIRITFDRTDFMRDWWMSELDKLETEKTS